MILKIIARQHKACSITRPAKSKTSSVFQESYATGALGGRISNMGQCNTVRGHEGLQRCRKKALLTRSKYALTLLGFKAPNMTAADDKVYHQRYMGGGVYYVTKHSIKF